MSDRYVINSAPLLHGADGGEWWAVVDRSTSRVELAGRAEHREFLQTACDRLNARDRLADLGHSVVDSDIVERIEPAECRDTIGAMAREYDAPWPFPRSEGHERYRWRYAACGTTVVYPTNAMGLQLLGRVVRRQTAMGEQRLVQLIDRDGTVFASVNGLSVETERVLQMEGSRGAERLRAAVDPDADRRIIASGTATGRITPDVIRDAAALREAADAHLPCGDPTCAACRRQP